MNASKKETTIDMFLNQLENIPTKQEIIDYVQTFIQDHAHVINSTQMGVSGINSILTSKFYMEAYIENIRIAKTILFRIKELTKKIEKLKSRYLSKTKHNNQICSYNDMYNSIIVIEKRIYEYSKMNTSNTLSRKFSPKWYYDQLQTDIQTLTTLLSMLQLDFMFYNYSDRTNTFHHVDGCSTTPTISLDSTYHESFYKCVDGVCSVLKPYFLETKSRKKTHKKKKSE